MKYLFIALSACGLFVVTAYFRHDVVSAQSPPARPAPPHPLAGVAAIVEANVVSARYTYDEMNGPRTEVTLDNIVVHRGPPLTKSTFSQFGGPLPDGRYTAVLELPLLTPGSRYIMFFAATRSYFSPIWARLAFRVETVGSQTIIVGPDGHAVRSFGVKGVSFGEKLIVDYSNHPDPRAALPIRADVVPSDVAGLLDKPTFLSQVQSAIAQIGPVIPSVLSLEPDNGGQPWNVHRTLDPSVMP